ncbi:MAG: hypothetical protein M1837_003189 [Sclerophora amabilis]|nr:MAG: hypothetical protein M1837_003189 [Sclerophora amabilis]
MYFSTAALAALATLGVRAGKIPRQNIPRTEMGPPADTVCQTSDGSPVRDDCQAALDALDCAVAPGWCVQTLGSGSFCTEIQRSGSCVIEICGPFQAHNNRSNIDAALSNLYNDCTDGGGLVGGYTNFKNGGSAQAYHS